MASENAQADTGADPAPGGGAGLAEAYLRFMNADGPPPADAIFSPSFVFWQNVTRRSVDRAEFLARVLALHRIEAFRYENVRLNPFPNGFVQRHEACGVTANADAFRVPACIVAEVEKGLIVRIDEYLDSAQDPRRSS